MSHEDGKVRFRFPLEDADIEHGNRALTAAAVPAEVWAETPHSCALIEEGIEQDGFAVLEDGGVPYLVGFTSGWGDGTYVWHSLKKARDIIGFSCVLIDPDE